MDSLPQYGQCLGLLRVDIPISWNFNLQLLQENVAAVMIDYYTASQIPQTILDYLSVWAKEHPAWAITDSTESSSSRPTSPIIWRASLVSGLSYLVFCTPQNNIKFNSIQFDLMI